VDITPSSIQGFFTTFSIKFVELFQRTPVWWNQIATLETTSSETHKIAWQGRIPTFREWVGPRHVHGVAAEGYTVTPTPKELTVSIDQFKIKDDSYGVYSTVAAQFGMQAKKLPDYLMVTALKKGASNNGPDAVSFWNNSHPVDVYDSSKGTYDNDFDLTLTPDNFRDVRAAMMTRQGQDGKPLAIMPNLLMVPPALEGTARQILKSELVANQIINGSTQVGGQSNIWRNICDLMVVPELASSSEDDNTGDGDKTWYLFDTSKVVKPLLYVLREAAQITYRAAPTDPVVFDQHQYLYGGVERSTFAYALPFLASRSLA
jgi:phage major head subunit gpT-like protein